MAAFERPGVGVTILRPRLAVIEDASIRQKRLTKTSRSPPVFSRRGGLP